MPSIYENSPAKYHDPDSIYYVEPFRTACSEVVESPIAFTPRQAVLNAVGGAVAALIPALIFYAWVSYQ